MQQIYLDNAATSSPKPQAVIDAVNDALTNHATNPGRAGHRAANNAARKIFEARECVASFFNATDSANTIFTANVTESLNMCLKGFLNAGDHVITTSMEHNSMMRPLRILEKSGVELSILEADALTGKIDIKKLGKLVKENTKIIAVNHVSNVCGTIQPIYDIGLFCKDRTISFLVDVAQSAGLLEIDMQRMNIDMLCFTGHKGLQGPMGIGGCIFGESGIEKGVRPLKQGGTGSNSEFELQPEFSPDKFECGTPNLPGILGLFAGIEWINKYGRENIYIREHNLTDMLLSGLNAIEGVTIHGILNNNERVGVISFTCSGIDCGTAAFELDNNYGVLCRAGLHCAPAAHKTLKTFPSGTLRFSIGLATKEEDIEHAVKAVQHLVRI